MKSKYSESEDDDTECREPLHWTEKVDCAGRTQSIMDALIDHAGTCFSLTLHQNHHCSAREKKAAHCSIWRFEYAELPLNYHHIIRNIQWLWLQKSTRHHLTQDSGQVSVSLIRQGQFRTPTGSQKGIHAGARAIQRIAERKLRRGARCRSEEPPT